MEIVFLRTLIVCLTSQFRPCKLLAQCRAHFTLLSQHSDVRSIVTDRRLFIGMHGQWATNNLTSRRNGNNLPYSGNNSGIISAGFMFIDADIDQLSITFDIYCLKRRQPKGNPSISLAMLAISLSILVISLAIRLYPWLFVISVAIRLYQWVYGYNSGYTVISVAVRLYQWIYGYTSSCAVISVAIP